jgi:lactocepin
MKKLKKYIAVLLAFVLTVSVMPAGTLAAGAAEHVGNERITVVVMLDDGISPHDAAKRMAAATPCMKVKYIYDTLINGFAAEINSRDSGRLAGYIGVKSVSEETEYTLPASDGTGQAVDIAEGSVKISLRADDLGGAGTVVAVLDSGFDVSHPLFKLSDPNSAAIKEYDVMARRSKLKAKTAAYVSPKIPFAYDYADGDTDVYSEETHGTGVAGIVAGNGKYYEGVAPEAQLILMKVFGFFGTSSESDVLAALEDAVTLGADVINLSIGSAVGADNGYPLAPALADALQRATQLGITINGAAGNDGHIGMQSVVNMKTGMPLPTTATIDYGTISSPASIGAVNAVASKNSNVEYEYYIDFDGMQVPFSDTTANYVGDGKSFTELLDGKTYKFVAVPGLGTLEDCAQVADSLKGAVALIKRGEITFVEKVNNAHAYGAVAAVVWDNIEDNPSSVGMELTGARIPAIFIEYKYGAELAARGSGSMTVKDKLLGKFPTEDYGKIADTSSWGVTPGFALKPDFASTGINVVTAAPNGGYTTMSGTSAASAYASGEAAALYAMLRRGGGEADAAEIRRRLMNTAELLTDSETGIYYSPRRQGAGEIKAAVAAAAEIALLDAETGEPKTAIPSLGKTSVTLELLIENRSNAKKTVSLSCTVQSDAYELYKNEDETYSASIDLCRPHAFDNASAALDGREINIYSADFEGAEITLSPGEKKQISVDISLDEETAEEYGSVFEYGFYLEGFVIADDGNVKVSLPYVCFTGDWDAMPIFDAMIYDEEATPYYDASYFYGISEDFLTEITLGKNWFTDGKDINKACVAFSPNADGEIDRMYLSIALLRSARDISGVITDSAGNASAYIKDIPYVGKTIASGYTFSVLDILVWDGSDPDNPYYIFPDGVYTLTIDAYPAYEGSTKQTYKFTFTVDTQTPVLKSMRLVKDRSGSEVLEISAIDDTALQGALVYANIISFYTGLFDATHTKGQKTADTYRFNIDGWRESGIRYVYVDIFDYAMNRLTVKVPLEELAAGIR